MTPTCPFRAPSPSLYVPLPFPPRPGGAGEQHRAGAELPAADLKRGEPGQPATLLEHVQQVWVFPSPTGGCKAGSAIPRLKRSWSLGEGSFLPGTTSFESRGSRAMDSGCRVLALPRCWLERLSAAPSIPTAGRGAQPRAFAFANF